MADEALASKETPFSPGLSSHTKVAFMSSGSALRPNPRNHGARWGPRQQKLSFPMPDICFSRP